MVTLPCASYPEMEEWSAGNFRNFLIKYPEAQTMHQKMLWISQRLEKLETPRTQRILQETRERLYRAQSNDAYWHGVFGGLYLRHLRRSVYAELLQAEHLLDAFERRGKKSWVEGRIIAQDFGHAGEVALRSPSVSLLLNPRQGGQLVEWSDKELGLNLLDTLTRRPEPYHKKAQVAHQVPIGAATGPETIHERHDTGFKGAEPLVYDRYRRAGLIDHALAPDSKVQDFALGIVKELVDFVGEPYEERLVRSGNRASAILTRQGHIRMDEADHPLVLKKRVTVPPRGKKVTITYQLVNRSSRMLAFLFGSELNLNLKDAHVNRVGEVEGVRRFSVTDPAFRLRVSLSFSHPARLWYFPLETLSDSERGLERTYQGVNITSLWQLALSAGKRWQVTETLNL
jgi:alpha-amylase